MNQTFVGSLRYVITISQWVLPLIGLPKICQERLRKALPDIDELKRKSCCRNTFSSFLCLYIQNKLNLFLLTQNIYALAKKRNSLFLFASFCLWLKGFCYLCIRSPTTKRISSFLLLFLLPTG